MASSPGPPKAPKSFCAPCAAKITPTTTRTMSRAKSTEAIDGRSLVMVRASAIGVPCDGERQWGMDAPLAHCPFTIAYVAILAAGDRADDQERFLSRRHRFGQRCIGRFQREILLAGEVAQERPAVEGAVVANGAAQHGVAGLQGIQHRPLRHRRR